MELFVRQCHLQPKALFHTPCLPQTYYNKQAQLNNLIPTLPCNHRDHPPTVLQRLGQVFLQSNPSQVVPVFHTESEPLCLWLKKLQQLRSNPGNQILSTGMGGNQTKSKHFQIATWQTAKSIVMSSKNFNIWSWYTVWIDQKAPVQKFGHFITHSLPLPTVDKGIIYKIKTVVFQFWLLREVHTIVNPQPASQSHPLTYHHQQCNQEEDTSSWNNLKQQQASVTSCHQYQHLCNCLIISRIFFKKHNSSMSGAEIIFLVMFSLIRCMFPGRCFEMNCVVFVSVWCLSSSMEDDAIIGHSCLSGRNLALPTIPQTGKLSQPRSALSIWTTGIHLPLSIWQVTWPMILLLFSTQCFIQTESQEHFKGFPKMETWLWRVRFSMFLGRVISLFWAMFRYLISELLNKLYTKSFVKFSILLPCRSSFLRYWKYGL